MAARALKSKGSVISNQACSSEQSHEWKDLRASPAELRPNNTLQMGQCFNWRRLSDDLWTGVVNKSVVCIKQMPNTTLYKWVGGSPEEAITLHTTLHDYFQLETSLEDLYARWSEADEKMAIIANTIQKGVRVIRQDCVECCFSFLCSSNNNICRIALMLDRLRSKYGTLLLTTTKEAMLASTESDTTTDDSNDTAEQQQLSFYSFPTLSQLNAATEQELRDL
eukprot:14770-Heterococcus_DN1.PRE.2